MGVTGDTDLRIRQPGRGRDLVFERLSWEHRSLTTDWTRDSAPYAGGRAGFFLSRPGWLAVSVEALHFKALAEPDTPVGVRGFEAGEAIATVAPLNRFVERYWVGNGVNMILGNVEAHHGLVRSTRFPAGRVGVWAGLGGGVTIPFTRSIIDGRSQGQYEWGRPAAQLLAGLSWRLTPRWDTAVEYKYTRTTVDGSIVDGDSLARLRTHHLSFGLGLHFGG